MFLRSFKFRITLVFTAIFISCSAVLFVTAYLVTGTSLANEERALLRSRLLEFWAVYQTGRVDLVRTELTLERVYRDERAFSLRITDPFNGTTFIYPPPNLKSNPYASLETLPLLNEGEVVTLRNAQNGLELVVSALRLPDGNLLEIGISNTERVRTLARFRDTYLLVLLPLIILSVLGGVFFSSRFISPVRKMVAGIREITATGDIHKRVPPGDPRRSGEELAELADHFNGLLAQIEGLVTDMRETIDNVAHDIRTPLTRLRAAADGALASGSRAELKESLSLCVSESEHVLSLLTTLLELSRAEAGVLSLDKRPVDLSALIVDFAELYSYPAQEKNVTLTAVPSGPVTAPADLNRLRQVLSNLIENALRHSPPGAAVTLAAFDDGDQAAVSVTDQGDGIPPEDRDRIWKRFYRGLNAAAPGFGLGLSMAKAVVEAHGGTIDAGNAPGKGTVFTFRLPR
jgi:signal transduction histidine kinase